MRVEIDDDAAPRSRVVVHLSAEEAECFLAPALEADASPGAEYVLGRLHGLLRGYRDRVAKRGPALRGAIDATPYDGLQIGRGTARRTGS